MCVCLFVMHKSTFSCIDVQMYGMAVANKLENNKNIFQRRYFRQVSIAMNTYVGLTLILYHFSIVQWTSMVIPRIYLVSVKIFLVSLSWIILQLRIEGTQVSSTISRCIQGCQ